MRNLILFNHIPVSELVLLYYILLICLPCVVVLLSSPLVSFLLVLVD